LFLILLAALAFVLYGILVRRPSPGLIPNFDIDLAMLRKAGELGNWFLYCWLVSAVASGILLYMAYYLQLLHGALKKGAWPIRWIIAYALPVIGGLILRHGTVNWVLDQSPETLIREAVADLVSAKAVTLSDIVLPLVWKTAAIIDLLVITALGCVVGYLLYLLIRKVRNV
jgi:hypothetical protein